MTKWVVINYTARGIQYNRVSMDKTRTDSSKWFENHICPEVLFDSKELADSRLATKKFGKWDVKKVEI